MIAFAAGVLIGATFGMVTTALMRAGDEHDCQLPTLGRGTWLVGIDQHGELVRVEPHACMEDAFKRLEQAMREEP